MKPNRRHPTYYKELIYTILVLLVAFAIGTEVFAQEINEPIEPNLEPSSQYQHAIGVRAGGTSGLTYKTFIGRSSALEFIAWGGNNSLGITGLYERYAPAFDVSGLNWYYGVGAHGKFRSADFRWGDARYSRDEVALGPDGIVGIEYKIKPIPFAVSLDLKPYVDVWTSGDVDFHIDPGLGVKFAF